MMKCSFQGAEAEALFEGRKPKRVRNNDNVAQRKPQMLDDATELRDSNSPPGNRPEALTRERAIPHSIRVNAQWRMCFVWTTAGPASVEIADYH